MRTLNIFILILCNLISIAQNDKRIATIRQTVNQINKDTVYTLRTLKNEQFLTNMTDGGGTLIGYFKNNVLVKVIEQVGLSSCRLTSEFYLKDSELIFAYLLGEDYTYIDSLAEFDYSDLKKVYEGRYYFNKGQLIDKKTNGSSRCSGQPPIDWTKRDEDEFSRNVTLLTK